MRHVEGVVHGFLALRTLDGKTLADGDLIQVTRGDRVTSRLVFRFRDGSLHDETAVFSQRHSFRLLTDHLVQKGPAFPRQLDVAIDTASGEVKVRYADADGRQKQEDERLELPPDVANGLVSTLLKNVSRDTRQLSLAMVAATPKPRLVKLAVARAPWRRGSGGGPSAWGSRAWRKIGGLSSRQPRFYPAGVHVAATAPPEARTASIERLPAAGSRLPAALSTRTDTAASTS